MNAPGTPRSRWTGVLMAASALAALAAVFLAYLDPHLAVDVANRLWSCF
jgi:hypothetical protein